MLSGKRRIRLPCFAMEKEMEVIMNQLFFYILFGFMVIMGGGTSLYLVISLPAVIIWKIWRKIKYGYKLTD